MRHALVSRYDTFPARSNSQGPSEASQGSNIASNLRATAPIFKPQLSDDTVTDNQLEPPDNCSQLQPDTLFDPFGLDVLYAAQLYHHMFPVPTVPFGQLSRRYSKSPRKSRNKKFTPNQYPRGPKAREYTNDPSPTKEGQSHGSRDASGPNESSPDAKNESEKNASANQAEDKTTPSPKPHSDGGIHSRDAEKLNIHCSEAPLEENIPFTTQIDAVIRQGTWHGNNATTSQRPREAFDWSSIHNVSSSSYSPHIGPPQNARLYSRSAPTYPGFGGNHLIQFPTQRRGKPAYPRRYGGNGLYDNFSPAYLGRNYHAAAGVPIHATIPFPNPVPPPGPRGHIEGGTPKEYVGFSVGGEKKTCGEVVIESANEWIGGTCNNCEPNH